MSPPKSSSANGNGPRNLFVETDSDHDSPSSPRASRATSTRTAPGRGRGLVVPVDPASSITAPPGGLNATSFTRPNARLGMLAARSRARIHRVEVNAGRLLGRVAARRHAALSASVVLAAALIAVGWLGLATHHELSARHTADQHPAARAALEHETARIHTLSALPDRAALSAGRQHATAIPTTAPRPRARAIERKATEATIGPR